MDKFVHDENIKLFRKQLAETTDPEKRRVLLKLIVEEDDRLLGEQDANGEPLHQGQSSSCENTSDPGMDQEAGRDTVPVQRRRVSR